MRNTRIDNFKIKEATREDSKVVLEFIKGLAIYEKMEDELTGTIADLEKNVWDNNYAEVILAYYNDIPVGMALFFTTFSTFTCKGVLYLEDLFILEEYRNKGFGREMFYQLANIAKERDYSRFEWVCLDWNEPSIRFYEDVVGAKPQNEWIKFRLDKQGIDNLVNKK